MQLPLELWCRIAEHTPSEFIRGVGNRRLAQVKVHLLKQEDISVRETWNEHLPVCATFCMGYVKRVHPGSVPRLPTTINKELLHGAICSYVYEYHDRGTMERLDTDKFTWLAYEAVVNRLKALAFALGMELWDSPDELIFRSVLTCTPPRLPDLSLFPDCIEHF